MTPEVWLEIFGYFGTALVLISFLLTDIKWLRIVNMSGGLVSLIYALCVNTMPVAVLNASLITINLVQLIRIIKKEREEKVNFDKALAYNEKENNKEEHI